VKEAAEAGYDALECVADGLGDLAKRYGVTVCGGYVGGPFHLPWNPATAEEKLLKPARQLAALGGEFLTVNCDPKGTWAKRERKTEDELKQQGENLSRLARDVKLPGLCILMHNHANSNAIHQSPRLHGEISTIFLWNFA